MFLGTLHLNWFVHIMFSEFIYLTCIVYVWILAAIAVKEKLESLCREFQRQNKLLKVCSVYLGFLSSVRKVFFSFCVQLLLQLTSLSQEECRRVSTEGQNMRMELSDKFNNAIKVYT